MNIPGKYLKMYSEKRFGSHLKHRLQLSHYIESVSAKEIIYWMKEYDLDYFCYFTDTVEINEYLGPGVFLFVNSVTEVMYVGSSDEMKTQLQKPGEYRKNDCIITINTRKFITAEKLESKLITALKPGRNKAKTFYAQRGWRQ